MSACFEIVSDIEKINLKKKAELPLFLDEFRELTTEYAALNVAEREELRNSISLRVSRVLLVLGNRSAERAIETKDVEWIRAAVIGHLIENARFDFRENIRNLILVNYASQYIGIDLSDVFKELNHIAAQEVKEVFDNFLSRSHELNKLETVGMKLFIDDVGKASFTLDRS